MFSATLPESVQEIAKSYLKPHYISVAVGEVGVACKDVTQTFIEVKKFDKKKTLLTLLNESGTSILIIKYKIFLSFSISLDTTCKIFNLYKSYFYFVKYICYRRLPRYNSVC